MNIFVDIVLRHPAAALPVYATASDAGIDLSSVEDVTIPAGERAMVDTGLSITVPAGHGGFLLPRSGLAVKHGITLANSIGLIDHGYTGPLMIGLVNLNRSGEYVVRAGDRIAQLLILPVPQIVWNQVAELSSEDRGGGFGHTGR